MRIRYCSFLGLISLALVIASSLIAQVQSKPSDLFQKLQSNESSDQAAEQLVQLGKSDSEVRAYIALHLPAVIDKNPHDLYKAWENATRIAGALKIVEALPALAKWVGADGVGPNEITNAEVYRLDTDPAARALAQIGDPAIPTLVVVLHSDKVAARRDAVFALRLIGSPQAVSALRDQETRESDPELHKLIVRILSTRHAQ